MTTAARDPFAIDVNHASLHYRRTKIVGTIGPASRSPEMLRALIRAGLNVARINFSHGEPAEHVATMRRIRRIAAELNEPVAILADLCGPKIRVGVFRDDQVTLKDGAVVAITVDDVLGTPSLIPSQYPYLARDVKVGGTILLDDGNLELKVVSKGPRSVKARVIHGGVLKNKKGMNLPDSALSVSALTGKDRRDVVWALKGGADYIALSFVRRASDVRELRRALRRHKADTPIIAKIEMPEALKNIEAIMGEVDGIMIARGDLGVELPARKVPMIQNRLIAIANSCNKPVIVATQMLESMIEHARPTRAEVTDVAAACLAGTDAVMLSAETAAGRYPLLAVQTMDAVLREAEAYQFFSLNGRFTKAGTDEPDQVHEALGLATAQLSRDLMVRSILVVTRSGYTARMVSADRPAAPVLAFTRSETIRRRLALLWGVYSFPLAKAMGPAAFLRYGESLVKKHRLANAGHHVLVLSGITDNDSDTNTIQVHRVR